MTTRAEIILRFYLRFRGRKPPILEVLGRSPDEHLLERVDKNTFDAFYGNWISGIFVRVSDDC